MMHSSSRTLDLRLLLKGCTVVTILEKRVGQVKRLGSGVEGEIPMAMETYHEKFF